MIGFIVQAVAVAVMVGGAYLIGRENGLDEGWEYAVSAMYDLIERSDNDESD